MTTPSQTTTQPQELTTRSPDSSNRFFNSLLSGLKIGAKLITGFGLLVFISLLIIGVSYISSLNATGTINRTGDVRVPIALKASSAQAGLLRMLSSTREYLFVGNRDFRQIYIEDSQAFENQLLELEARAASLSEADKQKLVELRSLFSQWKPLVDRMFDLRDDQLEREPAYKLLATDGIQTGGSVLVNIQSMIELQAQREPSQENIALLRDMANFQGSFSSMLSGLRGYVTTRNRIFRGEYESNRELNDLAWERLSNQQNTLTPAERELLGKIRQNRDAFLALPNQMFADLEGDNWRQDLTLFQQEAQPLGDKMLELLSGITQDQQDALQLDLNAGRDGLTATNFRTQILGLVALLLGLALTFIFQDNIAGPIQRLTAIAERIRGGDLAARAQVESQDEVGTLATAFNSMTGQLRQTIDDVRREKKRADNLLNVVIPIGVSLTEERDFNRLLENMLLEAKAFCKARAGTLYLRTEENILKFAILRNDAQNLVYGGTTGVDVPFAPLPLFDQDGKPNNEYVSTYVALNGVSVNLPTIYDGSGLNFAGPRAFNAEHGYEMTSFLTIPLKNSADQVLGVMQLIDAQDPETGQVISFDPNLQQMMESFSSLAVAALEAYVREQNLRQQIQQLHIEIDEAKRQKQVSEIVDTDFFQDLQSKARAARNRGRKPAGDEGAA